MDQTIDKSKELKATLTLLNNRLHFSGNVDSLPPVSIDYTPPLGDNLGYTSLELLLLSLGSCMGSAILTLLRRMKKEIIEFEMKTRGVRKVEHPTCFETIFIDMYIKSPDITDKDLDHVVTLSEEKYCPVWAMVKGNVNVEVNWVVLRKAPCE